MEKTLEIPSFLWHSSVLVFFHTNGSPWENEIGNHLKNKLWVIWPITGLITGWKEHFYFNSTVDTASVWHNKVIPILFFPVCIPSLHRNCDSGCSPVVLYYLSWLGSRAKLILEGLSTFPISLDHCDAHEYCISVYTWLGSI